MRPYLPLDRPALVRALQANVPEYFDQAEVPDLPAFLDSLNLEPEKHFVSVIENEIAIGGIGYSFKPASAEIEWIFFHPEYRKKGLGSSCMNHFLDECKKRNLQNLIVETSQLVFEFFQKFGFELKQISKDHWGPGLDGYSMMRHLN